MPRYLAALLLLALVLGPVRARADEMGDYIERGDGYFRARDYEAAAGQFGEAAERFPRQPIPRLALGHTLFALGRYAEASASLQVGIALLPRWSRSGINLRGFFGNPREFDVILEDLAHRLAARPRDPHLLFVLGYALHFTGRAKLARRFFDYLLAIEPGHVAALTFLAPDGS